MQEKEEEDTAMGRLLIGTRDVGGERFRAALLSRSVLCLYADTGGLAETRRMTGTVGVCREI
jgi:hypothetical protein